MIDVKKTQDLLLSLEDSTICKKVNSQEISSMVLGLCEYWYKNQKDIYMDGVDGAPDWKEYEHRIWSMGEQLRLFLKKRKDWRGKCEVLDAASTVLLNKQYGKGRQTFALLLGDFGGKEYEKSLSKTINDPEVCGHTIKSLSKTKITGYEKDVEKVFANGEGWIKSAAKKYLSICNNHK